MDPQSSRPLDPNEILVLSKALEPLDAAALAELRRIEKLVRLERYSEQDVREDIITPILRAMGYQKESIFSVDRERSLWIAGKRLAVDYSVTLWEENFWVIEAKKPSVTKGRFGYDSVWQAVQYAIHPEINAALVVLCDGHAIEVFDRDHDLRNPVLRVERAHLVRDFDLLRAFLGPFQAWFFEKRRIIRLIDKVFDREFNLGRAEEFRKLVDRRLKDKEQRIIENMRALPRPDTPEKTEAMLRTTGTAELVESWFWLELSWPMMRTIAHTLSQRSRTDPFPIVNRVLPDAPRPANHAFHVMALHYLIELHAAGATINWLPDWLTKGAKDRILDHAIEQLIALCLTSFEAEPARRLVLLQAAATRRIAKLLFVLEPQFTKSGQLRHVFERHFGEEFGFNQIVSSPERQLILEIERLELLGNQHFVTSMTSSRRFSLVSAEQELRRTWASEISLLQSARDYPRLLAERSLGETFPTEANAVVYDQLAHGALCLLDEFPGWKQYTLAAHRQDVETIAKLGSWQARKWLDMSIDERRGHDPRRAGDRFFLGDAVTAGQLALLYGYA